MEEVGARLGADFSMVHVHTEDAARASATALSARAYTSGSHVVTGDGGAGKYTVALQRSIGNAAVSRMLEPARHQHGYQQTAPAPVQRSAVHDVLSGPGQPLGASLKEEMEARLGADFSMVRVHTDDAARAAAAEVGARAYTSGNHVVIGQRGADKHTMAHELTHVIQQRQGPVAGTDLGGGLTISHPADRFERAAEATASQVMTRPLLPGELISGAAATAARTMSGPTPEVSTGQARSTPLGMVIQMLREWTGLDADRYREENGEFSRFDNNTNSWVRELPNPRELISQYFGGMPRAEAPPLSIAHFVGKHVKPSKKEILDMKPEYSILQRGIVGAWDTSLARTGHALGTGPPEGRQNQLGDGIYVVNPGQEETAYQHLEDPSIVYNVYAMKGVQFNTKGDHMQTVFTNREQFSMLCFVESHTLPSVRQEMPKPPPVFDLAEYARQQPPGIKTYSMF